MSKCKVCPAEIVYALTDKGKPIPLDAEPNDAGNVLVTYEGGRRRAKVLSPATARDYHGDRRQLYMPHHATCPNWQAKKW